MRYRIEYLLEPTDEKSVCHTKGAVSDDLEQATREALGSASMARKVFGATGFQIRELTTRGKIVALEYFDP